MATKITMPQLGESVAEGTVGRWLKREGDLVKMDESLVEIITDKVTAELPSPAAGRLTRILVGEDQTVKVGTAIAEIDESGGAGASPERAQASAATPAAPAAPTAAAQPAPAAMPSAIAMAEPALAGAHANGNGHGAYVRDRGERVSPLARRMAQEHQVDLHAIQGTGEGGRVRKEDILAFVDARDRQPAPVAAPPIQFAPAAAPQPAATAPARPAAPPVTAAEGDEIVTPSPIRRAIAEHMVRSKQTSPHATTIVEVDMTGITRWLDQHRDAFKQREGFGISYVPFVIKATVEALKEFPYLNASWTEDNKIVLRKRINIGVSIALQNGLIVPVIRDADTLNIAGLARAVSDLATRARGNKLQPAEVQGATFTVNNPGVFGTIISMAVINQPNAAILTMDAVVKRPVVVEHDAIAIRSMMFLGMSFDHRVVDGGTAAPFLASVRRRLEAWSETSEVY
ncbi:MAG TPA: dihydrolipoamide acetyltransferase family protein [Ktedonobacterales bacterium]|nr:dihydrolipoamide acetyltransferase family protein [Ktedonobacterales bacterium]